MIGRCVIEKTYTLSGLFFSVPDIGVFVFFVCCALSVVMSNDDKQKKEKEVRKKDAKKERKMRLSIDTIMTMTKETA